MIKDLWKKYEELIMYVVFGALTTLVNFAAFMLFSKLLGEDLYLVTNGIAWIISVIFAYITNKLFVFQSKSFEMKVLIKEIPEFFLARVFSFLVEEAGMWLFIDLLKFSKISLAIMGFELTGQLIAKLILAVIVVIMNYFFSKFIIFKEKSE